MKTNVQKIKYDADKRVETGVVQFGDDWCGTFIRGDNAFAYAMYLDIVIKYLETGQEIYSKEFLISICSDLKNLLSESNEMSHTERK